eukprot:scaffold27971_cov20-Tisochrysis_lutea.AAC.1
MEMGTFPISCLAAHCHAFMVQSHTYLPNLSGCTVLDIPDLKADNQLMPFSLPTAQDNPAQPPSQHQTVSSWSLVPLPDCAYLFLPSCPLMLSHAMISLPSCCTMDLLHSSSATCFCSGCPPSILALLVFACSVSSSCCLLEPPFCGALPSHERCVLPCISQGVSSLPCPCHDKVCASMPCHKSGCFLALSILCHRVCHIAVGTPGRLCQLIQAGSLRTEDIAMFVLDEADALLGESLYADVTWVYDLLPRRKQVRGRQAMLPYSTGW